MALNDLQRAGLRFITGIRYHKDMLERLNNMTFVYDSNWNPNNSDKATFPVAFFHVKSYHETMSAEVSQKQMLFYNSDVDPRASDPSANSGLLNVIADNIVIKPKVYKLDVIVPYKNLSLFEDTFVHNKYTNIAMNEILTNKGSNDVTRILSSWGTLATPYMSLLKSLLKTLVLNNYAEEFDFKTWLTNTIQQPDFNKQSLELMWKLRRIVKMKMWNSWEYKFVAITDIDISKEGTEDGVYEATLTVQEMPIATMYNEKISRAQKNKFVRKNPLLEASGAMAINILDYAGGLVGNNKE